MLSFRECIVNWLSVVFAMNTDWSWTYLLYQQPNMNKLCLEKHFGPLRSFIICFWGLFNSLLARNKVPTKFHRTKTTLFHSPSLSLTPSDFSLPLARKALIGYSMFHPNITFLFLVLCSAYSTVKCYVLAIKVLSNSVLLLGYWNPDCDMISYEEYGPVS